MNQGCRMSKYPTGYWQPPFQQAKFVGSQYPICSMENNQEVFEPTKAAIFVLIAGLPCYSGMAGCQHPNDRCRCHV